MRKLLAAGVAALILSTVPVAAAARVAPMTPEQQLMLDRKNALENAVRDRFTDGQFNRIRDMYGIIVLGEERGGRAGLERVLVKDEHGWFELRGTGRSRVPPRIAHELNRLLIDADLFAETAYTKDLRCARPQLFVLRHAGNEQFGRQCGTSGLSGKVAHIGRTFRIPSGREVTTAPLPAVHDARYGIGPQEAKTGHVANRAREMIYAWERWSLAGAVDPYADNAIVEFADGRVLRGRPAIVEWTRRQQDWKVPGLAFEGKTRGYQYQRGTVMAPVGDTITEMREVRWQENGRPMRRTYSAMWRLNAGLWQIVHERVSEDKPVTSGSDRQIW